MEAIKISGLCYDYPGKPVLKDINLSLSAGSFTAVLGPNGCGKTTLLKNISGYLNPGRGQVLVLGTPIQKLAQRDRARMVGYIPQNTSPGFGFTCRDVVGMGRLPYLGRFQWETREDREAVQEAMEQTDTWNLRDRQLRALSGGEMQRVLIARALAQKPRVLLMDEPVSHLDIKYQVEIISLVKRLCHETGITAVAVLHDINLASRYCGGMVLIKEGSVVSTGSASKVITGENIRNVFDIEVDIIMPHRLVIPR
ncbi:MAG: ABC transporter ATP-binding protein [Clostridia bacterium]|jgi:iron complex transport system ATP-binding protein|nr:ABC transporter ATP-binding protein [Clostridiales bacterium]